jgi:hypothetical protein
MPQPRTATYQTEIDWNVDGDFADAEEDVSSDVLARSPIEVETGRDQIKAFAPPMAGRFRAELDNRSRLYSRANAGSVLYGLVTAGPTLRFRATEGTLTAYNQAGVAYNDPRPYNGRNVGLPVFLGTLEPPEEHPELAARSVTIEALGPFAKLARRRISTALYQNILTSDAAAVVFAAAGLGVSDYETTAGSTTLDWWWVDDELASDALIALFHSEGPGSAIVETPDGKVRFEGRNYRQAAERSLNVQATFRDTTGANIEGFVAFHAPNPERSVINEATATVRRRALQGLAKVWEYGANITLGPNEVLAVQARPSDPFSGAITPVGGVDYQVTAGSLVSATIDRSSGGSCTLTLTAGGSGATVAGVTSNGIQIRAQAATVTSEVAVRNNTSTPTTNSIARYGLVSRAIELRAEMSPPQAISVCDLYVQRYRTPRPHVEIRIRNRDFDHLNRQLTLRVGDRVAIEEAQTGVSAHFWIERIFHVVSSAGLMQDTVLGCEEVFGDVYGLWGTGIWGTSLWG